MQLIDFVIAFASSSVIWLLWRKTLSILMASHQESFYHDCCRDHQRGQKDGQHCRRDPEDQLHPPFHFCITLFLCSESATTSGL